MHQEISETASKFELVAWIEERGAKVGARVELKGEAGLWIVDTVGNEAIEEKNLRGKQQMDRRSLTSVSG